MRTKRRTTTVRGEIGRGLLLEQTIENAYTDVLDAGGQPADEMSRVRYRRAVTRLADAVAELAAAASNTRGRGDAA